MVLSLLLLSLSLVYATPVPFNLLKSIVAPIAVTSSFSSFGNLPSRSIALSQSQIHSQIQSIPYSVPQSSFGAVGSSRFGTESRSANTVKMIVGGTDVDTNQFPFYLFGYSGKGLGGGTMIAPNVMLTAAHCSGDLENFENYRVVQYMKDTSKTVAQQKSILYKVTKVINHPDYVNAFLGNDIALWFLEELGNPGKRDPIIDYPLLPSLEDEMMGGVLTAVGFGQTKFNGEVSKTLKRLDTPIVPTNEARSFFEKILRKNVYLDDAKQICVASNQNNIQRSVLPGGPLFRFINGKFILYGLTSWGVPDPRVKGPSVFTKIAYFTPWIKKVVDENTRKLTAEDIAKSSAEAVGERE